VYCRTAKGKADKRQRNARRNRCEDTVAESPQQDIPHQEPAVAKPPADGRPVDSPPVDELSVTVRLRVEGVVLDESSVANSSMLPYVRMVIRVLEGVRLTGEELVDLLRRTLRQRSIDDRPRIDKILSFLHQHPPSGEWRE
jgi:hypothetical protein